MIERLRKPGGTLGTLSVVSAFSLAAIGVAGIVAMLVSLATGADFWSDNTTDLLVSLLFFAIAFAGAVGFWLMDRSLWLGAGLAVVGGLAFAFLMFWAVLPVVIGLGAAVVGVLRARALHGGTTTAPRPA